MLGKLLDNVGGIYSATGLSTTASYVATIGRTFPAILKSRNLVPADEAMRGRVSYHLQGVTITLDASYFSAAREMYCRQVYFPTHDFDLRHGTTVIDLGANRGLFSVLAAKAGCRAIAVEAQRVCCAIIRKLAAELEVNVEVVEAIVGPGTGALTDSRITASLDLSPTILTMDELIGNGRVDFLKCDIEGSEFDLFRGNCAWLDRVDRIAMETHRDYGEAGDLERTLHEHGFTVERRAEYLFALR